MEDFTKYKIKVRQIFLKGKERIMKFQKIFSNKILISLIIGIVIGFSVNFVWDFYKDYSQYQKMLSRDLIFRYEFLTNELEEKEIKTKELTGSEYETRIVLIQNFDYFEHAGWFSAREPETFPDTYSGILFYDFNPATRDYELVYKLIPLALDQTYIEEEGSFRAPLLLTQAHIGDIDSDGKNELITEWSVCNFNHCVWIYPIIIGFDNGYYVKWVMPKHDLTEHDLNIANYNWGGQTQEREIINLHDNRKYKINCGNYIEYKIISNDPTPYIVSYNIDDKSCWACDQRYLLDLFNADNEFGAKYTYHNSEGLSEHFKEVEDFNFIESISLW